MILVPAIDILGGQVVRLKRGDYEQVTVYNSDPLAQARLFVEHGAERIHIVDLDGARDGRATNLELISHLVRKFDVEFELGGGIRTLETFERYLHTGITRLVLGSVLASDQDFCRRLTDRYADNVVAGVDARGGMLAIDGWRSRSKVNALELIAHLKDFGIHELIYTDIARDGMQSGIDTALYERIASVAGFPVTASGGVSGLDDLLALKALPSKSIDGVIVGRALYEGRLDLDKALALCKETACSPNA